MGTISAVWDLYHSVQQTQTCNGRRTAAKFVINITCSTLTIYTYIFILCITFLYYLYVQHLKLMQYSLDFKVNYWHTFL
jgi:hypothetical protein